MTKKELIALCLTFPGAYEDYPFDGLTDMDNRWAVMRHRANKKGFAFIYEQNCNLCVNIKCDPLEADFLRQAFHSVTPAYHMNKTHWNTVTVDGNVPEDELRLMIEKSYDLIKPKQGGKRNHYA